MSSVEPSGAGATRPGSTDQELTDQDVADHDLTDAAPEGDGPDDPEPRAGRPGASGQAAAPQLYLNTPYLFEPERFAEDLARALDAGAVACVRLRLRGASEDELRFAIDALRPVCHEREVALIVSDYFRIAAETGLDGVHFELGQNAQLEARTLLGEDAIIGVSCGASKHLGLTAGERGADYVVFHPVVESPAMQTSDVADRGLFEWWQEMIELPVVAEGGMTPEFAAEIGAVTDFVAASRSVWRHPDGPAAAVRAYVDALARAEAARPPSILDD